MNNQPEYTKVSAAAQAARDRRKWLETMREGQQAVLDAGETYLPRLGPLERDDRYQRRKALTQFTNFVQEAVGFAVGQMFSRPIKRGEDIPNEIKPLLEDVDLRGNALDVFLMELVRDFWWTGAGLFLVDMPPAPDRPLTLAEERAIGRRPYFARYPAASVLGWRERYINGRKVYAQLRLEERVMVEDGEYGEKPQKQIRVLWAPDETIPAGSFALFAEVQKSGKAAEWEQLTPRTAIDLDEIPLVILGDLEALPPLSDLADLNKADYQMMSVLRNIEQTANVPIPYVTGVQELNGLRWSSDSILTLGEPTARVGYWEHSGACIGELKKSIEANRVEMSRRAMRSLLEGRTGDVSATSDALNAGRMFSQLQAASIRTQDAGERGLQFLAKWLGLGDDVGGSIEVNRKFLAVSAKDQSLAWVQWLHGAGLLSDEAAFAEGQRVEAISESLDWDEEREKVASQAPKLGEVGKDRAYARRVVELVRGGMPQDEAEDLAEEEMMGRERVLKEAA